jgi:hypothetical protein
VPWWDDVKLPWWVCDECGRVNDLRELTNFYRGFGICFWCGWFRPVEEMEDVQNDLLSKMR